MVSRARGLAAPRWRKVGRDLWLHKARTLLVVLAIAVGLMGAGAVLDTWSLVRGAIRDQFGASNPASATLHTDALDAALLARARAVPGVAEVQARRVVTAAVEVEGAWRTARLFAMDDFSAVRIGVLEPAGGAWPPTDGAIVVETSSVELARTGVGETLTVRAGDGEPVALPVTGVARDVGLAPGWMEHVVYAFVTPATLARLGVSTGLDELQLVVAPERGVLDRDRVRRIAYAVKAALESAGHPVGNVDVPVPRRHIHAAQMESLLLTQGAFGVLLLLLSAVLVLNLVTAMLAGQAREIGVMKAIGARRGQLAAMYLGAAALLGLVAAALGLPAAAVAGRAFAAFTAQQLNFDLEGAAIPLWVILLQLAVAVLLPLLAAAAPVARAARVPVAESLRDFGLAPRSEGAGPGLLLRHVGGVTRPLLLSLRNAFRRRQRMALTLATLALGGAVYLGSLNLRAAIAGSVDLIYSALRFDLSVRLPRAYPPRALEAALADASGLAGVEAWAVARAALARADGTLGNAFPLTGVPAGSTMLALAPREGRWLRAGDASALVVNRALLADEPGLRVGGEATLLVGGRSARWRVVGIVDGGPSKAAYALRDVVAASLGDGGANVVVALSALPGPAAQRELAERLRSALVERGYEVDSVSLMAQQRQSVEDHLLMVAGFLGIMGQLMIVVGGLGLASTMSLAVLERTREIGVLRAIGARRRAILALVQVEALVVALLSWAIALPLSVPMSVALGAAFGRVMFRVPVVLVPEPSGVARWLAVVVVVSLVAGTWPAWRATRVTTATALAYE